MELNRTGIIDRLKAGTTTIDNFNYDKLTAPPLSMILSQYDIDRLYNIATSVRYAGNVRKKYKAIDEILVARDFSKLSAGTNRLCYRFHHDDRFVIKVAYDSVAIQDSPAEFSNQFILKPFCTKVFEVDPCGVVGSFERVDPITSREEFASVADDAFYLIDNWLLSNGHIMADVGTKYFMNYGLRRGFGLVVIDFPYLYEIDGNKIFCVSPDNKSETGVCGGIIDFDPGFNELYCEKCGTKYRVKEIAKEVKEGKIIVKGKGGNNKMKVKIMVGGRDITERDNRIDGFKPEATKISAAPSRGRVAVRTEVRNSDNQRHEQVNSRAGETANAKTISVRPARQGNYQYKDDNYTRPANSSKVSVHKEQVVKPSRPLPERKDQKQSSDISDSRGKTVVSAAITDDYHLMHAASDATSIVTSEEAQYVMREDGNVPVEEKKPSEIIDNIQQKLETAEKAEAYYKKEMEKFKNLAEQVNAELEQCKRDLETSEEKKADLSNIVASFQKKYDNLDVNYHKLQESYYRLESINETNSKTIEAYKDSTFDFESTIREANLAIKEKDNNIMSLSGQIVDLQKQNKNLEDQLKNQAVPEIDPNEYMPIKEYEAKMKEIGVRNEEMNTTVRKISEDLYDFCDFTLAVDDHLLKSNMAAVEGFSPEMIEGTSNVDAAICKLSDLFALAEGQEDHYVFAFNYGGDAYLSNTDGKYVIASTIGGIPLDNFVTDGFKNIISNDLYEKYFAEEEEDEESEETVQEQEFEHVEGEVVNNGGNDNAENDNSREN